MLPTQLHVSRLDKYQNIARICCEKALGPLDSKAWRSARLLLWSSYIVKQGDFPTSVNLLFSMRVKLNIDKMNKANQKKFFWFKFKYI